MNFPNGRRRPRWAACCVVVLSAAVVLASGEPRRGGLPASLDPLDRPVRLEHGNRDLEAVGLAVGDQIGLPVEFDWPELQRIGVRSPIIPPPPTKSIRAGAMLWRCVVDGRSPGLIFVVRRDVRGAAERIVFTSLQAAEQAGLPLSCERSCLEGLLPYLDESDLSRAAVAIPAIARFGAAAEEALPHLERLARFPALHPSLLRQCHEAIATIRAAVARARSGQPGGRPSPPGGVEGAAVAKLPQVAPLDSVPPEQLDPLQRRVRFKEGVHPLAWFAGSLSRQIGIPVRIRGADFRMAGVERLPTAKLRVDDEPAVDALWRYWVRGRSRSWVFVVRKDVAGRTTEVEFATLAGAAGRGDPLPFDVDGLAKLSTYFNARPEDRLVALQGLRCFGQTASEALRAFNNHPGREAIPYFAAHGQDSAALLERLLRRREAHHPKAPFPAEADPLSVRVRLSAAVRTADQFAQDLADATGVPIRFHPEDLPADGDGAALKHRLGAEDEPLREVAWRCSILTGCRVAPQRDAAGRLTALVLGSAAGGARRGDPEIADEDSARILLRLAAHDDYFQKRDALLALRRVGAALAAEVPRRPETDWVGGAAAVHWRNLASSAEEAMLQSPVAVVPTEHPQQFVAALAAASRISVRCRGKDFEMAGIQPGPRVRFEAGPTPLRELLWGYVLRAHDQFAWVVRSRDAAGAPDWIEIVTWEGVERRRDVVLLDRRDLPTILRTLEWGLQNDRQAVVFRCLRLFHRLGAEGEEALPRLVDISRSTEAPLLEAFQAAIVTVQKASQAARNPHHPAKLAPSPAEWGALRVSLPERPWPVDDLARAVADQTGTPVRVRYEDLARRFASLASGPVLTAQDEPLETLLVRYGRAARLEHHVLRRENGEPRAIEIGTPEGFRDRRRAEARARGPALLPGG